jgi:hypothetical protein
VKSAVDQAGGGHEDPPHHCATGDHVRPSRRDTGERVLYALAAAYLLLSVALWVLTLRTRQVLVLLIDRNGHVQFGESALARGVELKAYLLRLGGNGPELVLLVDPRAVVFLRRIRDIGAVVKDP